MREAKVVNALDDVWPFDSPRDDNEGADKGCFKSRSARTTSHRHVG